jgi:hypothetical protein
MDDRDDVVRDALLGATTPLPAGLEERAVAAMAAATPSPRNGRSRLIPIAVGVAAMLLTLGLDPFSALRQPPTRQGPPLVVASVAAEAPEVEPETSGEEQSPEEKAVAPYRRRAAEFVRAHYPRDADMLMAAGLLTTDPKTSLALLKEAITIKGSSAAWTAYVIKLAKDGPAYCRPGESGIDPADPRQVAEEARMARETPIPDRLSEKEVAPILAAIHDWERADPRNAMPLVYEVWYLYGLHRDAEALARWREAGRLPTFGAGYWEQVAAVAHLLSRMGMSSYQAASTSWTASNAYGSSGHLRSVSRIASYEGRLAQLEGRARDAIAWWNATMQVGRHAAASADTVIQVLVGGAIEGIGAAWVWRWVSDGVSGAPNGPIMGGRIYQGRAYDFYVSQAGQQAADGVRDSLLKAKVHSMLMGEYHKQQQVLPEWHWVLGNAGIAGIVTVAFLVVFLAVGTWRRRQADSATRLGRGPRVALAVLALLPAAAGAMLSTWSARHDASTHPFDPDRVMGAGLLLAVVFALLLPLIAAWASRRPGARTLTAWRGNLRQTLPLAIAISGALALCLAITGKTMQAAWTREWFSGHRNEMTKMVQSFGPEWDHPHIPPDAWRAEPIPEVREK